MKERIMKENFTSINVLIDSSGSMAHLTKDTIGGFNSFLVEQKAQPGTAMVTLCTFSTTVQPIHDCVDLQSVPNLTTDTYRAKGGTALLDTMGLSITKVGNKLAAMPEEERPSKVIFLIITDGEENSSKEYVLQTVKDMVSHQREKYNWEFVFIGANMDAISAGANLGVATNNSLNYEATMDGTKKLYQGLSKGISDYRMGTSNKFDATTVNVNIKSSK